MYRIAPFLKNIKIDVEFLCKFSKKLTIFINELLNGKMCFFSSLDIFQRIFIPT